MKYVKIFIFLSTITLLVFGVYSVPKLIIIKIVTCKSQFGNCNHEISSKLHKAIGKNLYSSKDTVDLILANTKLIKKHSVQFRLPTTLEVDVLERKPRYALSTDDQKWKALLDKDGVVLGIAESSDLPTLKIRNSLPNPGEIVDEKTLFASKVTHGTSLQHGVLSSEVQKDGLRVELSTGKVVIYPLEGNVEYLLGSLNIIIGRLNKAEEESKIEGVSDLKTIDLRFKNPILK